MMSTEVITSLPCLPRTFRANTSNATSVRRYQAQLLARDLLLGLFRRGERRGSLAPPDNFRRGPARFTASKGVWARWGVNMEALCRKIVSHVPWDPPLSSAGLRRGTRGASSFPLPRTLGDRNTSQMPPGLKKGSTTVVLVRGPRGVSRTAGSKKVQGLRLTGCMREDVACCRSRHPAGDHLARKGSRPAPDPDPNPHICVGG